MGVPSLFRWEWSRLLRFRRLLPLLIFSFLLLCISRWSVIDVAPLHSLSRLIEATAWSLARCPTSTNSSTTDGQGSLIPSTCPVCPSTSIPSSTTSSSHVFNASLVLDLCHNQTVPYPFPIPNGAHRFCSPALATPAILPWKAASRYTRADIAVSLLTADAYKLSRDEAALRTWLSPHRMPFGFFGVTIARPEELMQPTLMIPNTDDSYISNLNKTMLALREMWLKYPDKHWYMQSSDDAYIEVDTLLLRLEPFNSSDLYYIGGAIVPNKYCHVSQTQMDYIGGGLGFLVSNGFMRKHSAGWERWILEEWLSPTGRWLPDAKFGDAMMGCFMKQLDIPITRIAGGHGEMPLDDDKGTDNYPTSDQRWWGWHHIDEFEFPDVHLFFTLQRIDQLQAHGQLSELADFARLLAMEQRDSNLRTLRLFSRFKRNTSLLGDTNRVQSRAEGHARL